MLKSLLVIKISLLTFSILVVLFISTNFQHKRVKLSDSKTIKTNFEEIQPSKATKPTSAVLGINTTEITPTTEIPHIQLIQKQKPKPVSTITKDEVYILINSYRESKGIPSLKIDNRLENSSLAKAKDMVNNNYFEHRNPWEFIRNAGFNFQSASENLAINYFSSDSIVTGWINSPSHNKTLLKDENEAMGLAFLCDVTITSYANTCISVIHFAKESE